MPISEQQIHQFEYDLRGASGTCLPERTDKVIAQLKELANAGFDFNSAKGQEFIIIALGNRNSVVLNAFLDHEATPEIEPGTNYLHIIAQNSKDISTEVNLNLCKACARVLIQHGIDPAEKNAASQSAYDLAAEELQEFMHSERKAYITGLSLSLFSGLSAIDSPDSAYSF